MSRLALDVYESWKSGGRPLMMSNVLAAEVGLCRQARWRGRTELEGLAVVSTAAMALLVNYMALVAGQGHESTLITEPLKPDQYGTGGGHQRPEAERWCWGYSGTATSKFMPTAAGVISDHPDRQRWPAARFTDRDICPRMRSPRNSIPYFPGRAERTDIGRVTGPRI
jgi:hypothetical protein